MGDNFQKLLNWQDDIELQWFGLFEYNNNFYAYCYSQDTSNIYVTTSNDGKTWSQFSIVFTGSFNINVRPLRHNGQIVFINAFNCDIYLCSLENHTLPWTYKNFPFINEVQVQSLVCDINAMGEIYLNLGDPTTINKSIDFGSTWTTITSINNIPGVYLIENLQTWRENNNSPGGYLVWNTNLPFDLLTDGFANLIVINNNTIILLYLSTKYYITGTINDNTITWSNTYVDIGGLIETEFVKSIAFSNAKLQKSFLCIQDVSNNLYLYDLNTQESAFKIFDSSYYQLPNAIYCTILYGFVDESDILISTVGFGGGLISNTLSPSNVDDFFDCNLEHGLQASYYVRNNISNGILVCESIFNTIFNNRDIASLLTYLAFSDPLCLLDDCEVLISDNTYKNITNLSVNDKVMGFFSKTPQTIKELVKHTYKIGALQDSNHPYLIKKNTFGYNVPNKDIHISGHHRILIKQSDTQFIGIQTCKLPNCVLEKRLNKEEVVYYHIVLENEGECLIVNNLPVESCVKD
jgi:hypothetical protein